MGRPKLFVREDILEKAMTLFWAHGYAHTSLKDLEEATGVNKSGLYSEFKDKEEIFIEALKHYYSYRKNRELLKRQPFGWKNIEDHLLSAGQSSRTQRGCFGVSTMRELDELPAEAREIIVKSRKMLKELWIQNIATTKTKLPPEAIAELLSTFYSGLCLHQNLKTPKAVHEKSVTDFVGALKLM